MDRRIILVDDHSLFRNGLRGLLEHCAGCHVVGEAASGEEFLAMIDRVEADIVFMDFAMPGLDGAQTTERALARHPELRIITLSMFGEESYYSRMVEAGAKGFLLKDSDIGDVLEAMDAVMAGGSYFSPQLLSSLTGRMRTRDDAPDEQLSAREREILVAVCQGLSNQEIADALFISKRTVDKHRANILEKTGCKNTASLVVYAIRNGIVEL
ncbi:DNA-binding response regulator [Alistipes sp. An116]|uniref:response regulator n=1 Tax=Alistipes TaxID=239759 RepID=UPI000B3A5A82|nr:MULTISPECIES: response regulator transcription factor [Alistipes]OUN76751.1 DNA-binding response regulator [Alistipes sp. An54]OUQ54149.1 DNA-binding response regulator [Alistipes sp. An116]